MSSIQSLLDEPLSPELALVCPELAERARHYLSEPRWAPLVRTEVSPRPGPVQLLGLALASIAIPASPLALLILAHH